MTEAETIKKMLEDPDSDNDEVNARIECCNRGLKYLGKSGETACWVAVAKYSTKELLCGEHISKYTTSLDAAMSIGAEELEGWKMQTLEADKHSTANCRNDIGRKIWSEPCPNTPRAIAHARIQALEYIRGL